MLFDSDFAHLLSCEKLASVLPEVNTIEDGILIYGKYYPLSLQHHHGVLALHLKPHLPN